MTREELLNIIKTDHVQCGEAAALARMALAYFDWQDKTAWVQTDKRFDVLLPWGKHRADVLKEYIEHLENRIAMDSEPVAYIPKSQLNLLKNRVMVEADLSKVQRFDEIPLYSRAQPPVVPEALEHLRSIVADPRLLPRRKEWISGQQYSYVLLEEVEAIVDDACRTSMLAAAPKETDHVRK